MANLAAGGIDATLNYKGIINLEVVNTGLSSTLQSIEDGDGVASCLSLATDKAAFNGNVAAGSLFTATAKFHAKAANAYDYLYRATDLVGNDIFQVREGIATSESVLSKYGYMCENSGSFQIAGFGATFGGDRVHLYSGPFMRVADPTSGFVIGIGGSPGLFSPHASALLDLQSTTKGFIKPRMLASEASAITPVDGLELYVTDTNGTFTAVGFWAYEAGVWTKK